MGVSLGDLPRIVFSLGTLRGAEVEPFVHQLTEPRLDLIIDIYFGI